MTQSAYPTSDTEALQAQACEQVRYWIDRARNLTGASAKRLPIPSVGFDLRGRAAGQAMLARRRRDTDRIRINAALLASHPDDILAETVPHEVAHVAVHRIHGHGARPHGPEWKALMTAFGVAPEPCHTLPTEPARRLRHFRYACGCDEPAWLTSIRHKRARRGTRYMCRRCGERLVAAPADGS